MPHRQDPCARHGVVVLRWIDAVVFEKVLYRRAHQLMSCFGIVLGQVDVGQSQVRAMIELCGWKSAGFELGAECSIFR